MAKPTRSEHVRYATWGDDQLFVRMFEVLGRDEATAKTEGGFIQWTREDRNVDAVRSGTVISPKVGRAIARRNDDARIVREIAAVLAERGGYTPEEIFAEYLKWAQGYAASERAAMAEIEAGTDAILGFGDAASFTISDDGEVETPAPVTVTAPVPAKPTKAPQEPREPKAPKAPKVKRDRLAWVATLQAVVTRHYSGNGAK